MSSVSNQYIFDLTDLTRNVNKDRRFAWQGFDIKRRHAVIGLCSTLFNGFLALMFYPVIGQGALILFFLFWGVPFLLIEGRSQQDMRLRHYQRLMDLKQANTGKFILCNRIVEPGAMRTGVIKAASVRVDPELRERDVEFNELDDLFA